MVAGARTSAQTVLLPLQTSLTSQGPAAIRQTAPALPGPTATQVGAPEVQSVRPTSQGLPVLHAAPGVQVQPDGAIALEWEAGDRGWLALTVRGNATLEHAAVLDGDDYGLSEDFGDGVPDWALEMLRRLHAPHVDRR